MLDLMQKSYTLELNGPHKGERNGNRLGSVQLLRQLLHLPGFCLSLRSRAIFTLPRHVELRLYGGSPFQEGAHLVFLKAGLKTSTGLLRLSPVHREGWAEGRQFHQHLASLQALAPEGTPKPIGHPAEEERAHLGQGQGPHGQGAADHAEPQLSDGNPTGGSSRIKYQTSPLGREAGPPADTFKDGLQYIKKI